MKKILNAMLLAAVGFGLTACEGKQDIHDMDMMEGIGMTVRSTSIIEGSSIRPTDSMTIDFNNMIGINEGYSITLNGEPVEIEVNPDNRMQLLLGFHTVANEEYTLEIPGGMIFASGYPGIVFEGMILNFNTNVGANAANVDRMLTNPNATQAAQNLYAELLQNYGVTMYSGAMGGVAWETSYTDYIADNNGGAGYPKVVGFDYIHLYASPANWIDYGDITPVKNVWDAGSIPAISWHWNVPANLTNTLSDTPTEMPGDWSGNIQIPASSFALTEPGTVVTVNFSAAGAGAQGSLKTTANGWAGIVDEDGTSLDYFMLEDGQVSPNVAVSGSTITLTLTPAILEMVKGYGLIISGHDYTVDSVTFNSIVYDASSISYNTRNFSAAKAVIPGTSENIVVNADLKKLAGYLSLLQDAGIPVLFRPLHEANGDFQWGAWFWWGFDGPQAVVDLWKYVREKLEGEYGLNNLIWVWTMDYKTAGQFAEIELVRSAYPGHELVDIVGTDIYPDSPLTDQSEVFNFLNQVVEGRKMLTLSEVGNIIDPTAAAENNALWSWFMQWYDTDPLTGQSGFGGAYSGAQVTFEGVLYPNQWAAVANSPYVTNRK